MAIDWRLIFTAGRLSLLETTEKTEAHEQNDDRTTDYHHGHGCADTRALILIGCW